MPTPKMTRQHFELIARVFRESPVNQCAQDFHPDASDAWNILVGEMADALSATNPAFNRARFLDACRGDT